MSEADAFSHHGPIVECVDVHKRFGDINVLRGVDLAVERGEFVAISGASGGGKSTLLHLMAALDRPTAGTIVVDGHELGDLRSVNRFRRHDIGIVFQLHNLLPHMSARRNVELAMFGTHRPARERAQRATALLTEFGLAHALDRSPTRLSGGERQRIAIARAIANEPDVLLADEPTGSLDPDAAATVLDVLDRLRREHAMTLVVVTHDPDVVARADRHLVVEGGRLRPAAEPAADTAHPPQRVDPAHPMT